MRIAGPATRGFLWVKGSEYLRGECGASAGHGFFLRVGVGLRGLVARELLSEEFEVTESSILLF